MASSVPVHRDDNRDPPAEPPRPSDRCVLLVAALVFATTVALRIPSCYESFWLDELHSAWVVWGDFRDVAARAHAGHQSPFYFWPLWFWKQVAGDSELALRTSSVLAVALSGVAVTIGATRWTGSLAAGAAAGMMLAVESNSLFFGTELRPYAWVILFSSLAGICFLELLVKNGRHDSPRLWSLLVIVILMAMLCQPTALGVLVWLPLVLMIRWSLTDRKQLLRCTVLDGLLVITVAAVALALWESTIGQSWGQRSNWSSFASATHLGQLVQIWDWTWLWSIPTGLTIVAAVVLWKRKLPMPVTVRGTLALAMIAVVATAGYWVISRAEWVPLWHRRYFVAVLPLFALVTAGAVATIESAMRQRWHGIIAGCVTAVVLVIGLAWQQGTLTRLKDYPVALVTRGEDWRGAIAWLQGNTQPADLVNLDSGMIEARNLPRISKGLAMPPEQLEYLSFPISGPYSLDPAVIPIRDLESIWLPPERPVVYVLTRRPKQSIDRLEWQLNEQVVSFRNLTVIVLDRRVNRSKPR